jgi:site-specific recombinase XerD
VASVVCLRFPLNVQQHRQSFGPAPYFSYHTMRHLLCSNAIEAGWDFKVIADWLGHKDGEVLVAHTYGHLRNEHGDAMARRLTFDAQLT